MKLAEHRGQPCEDGFEIRLVGRILRPMEQIVNGVELADEDHGGAFHAPDRFGRRNAFPFAQPHVAWISVRTRCGFDRTRPSRSSNAM